MNRNSPENQALSEHLIVFDGVCHFCAASVKWLLHIDRHRHFHFATLQSPLGREIAAACGIDVTDFDSFIYVRAGDVPQLKSEAALAVANTLGGAFKLTSCLRVLPLRQRDAVYDWIARNRYRWFGRNQECIIPTQADRNRILTEAGAFPFSHRHPKTQ